MLSLALFIITFTILIWVSGKKPRNFPPGPPRLPILGSMPFLFDKDAGKLSLYSIGTKIFKKYGPISGFFLGNEKVVVISNFQLVKEILKNENTSYRAKLEILNEIMPGRKKEGQTLGIVTTFGKPWYEQRRFVTKTLKDFGFGKTILEPIINYELIKLIEKIHEYKGSQFDINRGFSVSIINTLWMIVCGESFSLNDPVLLEKVNLINRFLEDTATVNPLSIMLPPFLVKLPILRKLCGYDLMCHCYSEMEKLIEVPLKKHLEEFDGNTEKYLIDELIKKVLETSDPSSRFYGDGGMGAVRNILIDLFMAGADTTSTSLIWTFLFLLHNPEIQEKVFEEIIEVVGQNSPVTLAHKANMHYTSAVLEESFRFTSLVPMNIPHFTSGPIKVGAYDVPKDTQILTNLEHIMNDPDYWRDPEVFRPERFLDSEGCFRHDERVIAFSIGKRICLGQALAEMELFLFLVGLLQEFKVKNPQGQELPSCNPGDYEINGLLRTTPSFKVIMEPRETSSDY